MDRIGTPFTVTAEDGIILRGVKYGETDAPLTVVLVHGHCLRKEVWLRQISSLRIRLGVSVQILCYDHRGHGRSDEAPISTYTVPQLGRDLAAVIDQQVSGRVVIAGHSMGGMTTLSYLRQFPDHRAVGVALISTSAFGLTEHGAGHLLGSPLLPILGSLVQRSPSLMRSLRRASRPAMELLLHHFGYQDRPGHLRTASLAVVGDAALPTIVGFLNSFRAHDESEALGTMGTMPVEILCGTRDLLTPIAHSRMLASSIEGSRLTSSPGAGHMLILERANEVSTILVGLCRRVAIDDKAVSAAI